MLNPQAPRQQSLTFTFIFDADLTGTPTKTPSSCSSYLARWCSTPKEPSSQQKKRTSGDFHHISIPNLYIKYIKPFVETNLLKLSHFLFPTKKHQARHRLNQHRHFLQQLPKFLGLLGGVNRPIVESFSSPRPGVVFRPLPNGRTPWLANGGLLNPYTLHETNSSPPKIDGWMKFPCEKAYFLMGVILTTY